MGILEFSLSSEKIFEIFNFPITNTFFWAVMGGILVLFLFFFSLRKRLIPTSFQNFIEWILEVILNYVKEIVGEKEKVKEVFPLAAFLFIFIFLVNLLEILPGLGVFPLLRSPSSDLNFTLALALVSMTFVHFWAAKRIGLFNHLKKFFNFRHPLFFAVGIMEGISEITRTLSLAVRLFGNLFAGEMLLILSSHFFSFLLPLPFLFLEIFVSFIQALIFSSLIIIFYVTATFQER